MSNDAVASGATSTDDRILPFQIEAQGLRGRLVRLGPLADEILHRHDYPPVVARMLAQMLTLAALLAGALKYEGVFTLQTSGNGPIRLMVADITSAGAMRGYAQFDAARLPDDGEASVPRLLGAGHLAFTVDQGDFTDRYQGIVELDGATLSDCIHHYFRQSEQLQCALRLAVSETDGQWRTGALMLQRMPPPEASREAEAAEDGWRRALSFMASVRNGELTDATLAPDALLYRLFHEDGVRVFRDHALNAGCRCSRERVEMVLRAMPADELTAMQEEGEAVVTCEFCNRKYRFDRDSLAGFAA
jgi:molecular chaperone Hsp33